MIVTINTDASFSPTHKIGTYAFWIVCNEGKIAKSGVLKKSLTRPEQAEFKCILNALHVVVNSNLKGVTKIIINTDCLNVIHLANKNKKAIQKYRLASWGNHLVSEMNRLMRTRGWVKVDLEFRHVKAHVSTSTKRQWVNEWCDQEAKKQLSNCIQTKLK